MSDVSLRITYFFIDLVLPLLVGQLLRQRTRLRPASFDRLIEGSLVFLVPVLTLVSFWGLEMELSLLWLPVIGVGQQAVAGLIAWLRLRASDRNPLDAGAYLFSTMLANRGVVGTLSVFVLYGEEGYAWSRMVLLLAAPSLYMLWFPLAQRFYDAHHDTADARPPWWRSLLSWRQMPLLGIAVGALLNGMELPRPAVAGEMFPYLVHLNAWMMILPIGASLDLGEMKAHWGTMPELIAIKFLIVPLVTLAMGLAVGLAGPVLIGAVIMAAAPTGIMAVVTAKLYGLNMHLAVAAFVVTTGVYMAGLYPLILLGLWLIGAMNGLK